MQNSLYRTTNIYTSNINGQDEIQKGDKTLRQWILDTKSGNERIFHSLAKGKKPNETLIIGYKKYFAMTHKVIADLKTNDNMFGSEKHLLLYMIQ